MKLGAEGASLVKRFMHEVKLSGQRTLSSRTSGEPSGTEGASRRENGESLRLETEVAREYACGFNFGLQSITTTIKEALMKFPKDLKYTESDEWIRVEGNIGTVGITDYAQDQLSDVVYVEITAAIGDTVKMGEAFAVVESVKAAADINLPATGKITVINEDLADSPELVNSDPYGAAWMAKFEIQDPNELGDLMDVEAYQKYVEERG